MRRQAFRVAVAFALLAASMQVITLVKRPRVVLTGVQRSAAPQPAWLLRPARPASALTDTAAIRDLVHAAVSTIDPESVRDIVVRGDTAWVTGTTRHTKTAHTYQLIRSSGQWRVWKLTRVCSYGAAGCSSAT